MSMSGRNINGKSKALKGSSQDYTNLLFSDSESDEKVPDLKLPPLKGKKQKRRRNVGLRPDDTCGVWNVFKVLFVILILAGMTALAAVTFWSLKKMTEMQDQIEKLQKSDAATPDTITNLQKNLATLDRSVTELKSTAEEMKVHFKDIDKKMEDLKNTKTTLDENLAKAEASLGLPKTVEILKKDVAEMGSDLTQIRNKDLKDLQAGIQDLQDKVTAHVPESSDNEKELPNTGPLISKLQDEVKAMNKTLNEDIAFLKQQVSELEEVIRAFTNAHSSDVDLRKESLNNLISETVMRIMKNSTVSSEMQLNNQTDDVVNRDITEVWAKQSDFLLFKQEVMMDMKYMNLTLGNFSEEFDAVQKHLIFNHNMITNLSILVERKSQTESEQPKASVTSGPLETTTGNLTGHPSQEHGTPENEESGKQDGKSTSDLENKRKIDGINNETGISDLENKLKIDGINNETALHEYFDGFATEDMNGQIPIAAFAQHLNRTAEELTQYDTDGDGNLTERELMLAMGFQTELKKRIKRNEW